MAGAEGCKLPRVHRRPELADGEQGDPERAGDLRREPGNLQGHEAVRPEELDLRLAGAVVLDDQVIFAHGARVLSSWGRVKVGVDGPTTQARDFSTVL